MSVAPVASGNIPGISGTTQSGAGDLSSRQTFMKLLVAQLRNQDPLSPMENTEMVNQLATISSVEHLESIRFQLAGLNQTQRTIDSVLASGLLGKTVGIDSDAFALTGSASDLQVEYRIPESGGPLVLMLIDGYGNQVGESYQRGRPGEARSSSLAGLFGQALPKGSYRLLAHNPTGELSSPELQAQVTSVVLPEAGEEPRVILKGSVPMALSQVRSVR